MVWNGRRGGGGGGGSWGCVCVSDWPGSICSGLCTFSGYVSGLVASEAKSLFHVSVLFFERHSVHGPNVFHCIQIMVGGWSVPRFISWESESLLFHVSVSSETSRDSFKLSPLVVEV